MFILTNKGTDLTSVQVGEYYLHAILSDVFNLFNKRFTYDVITARKDNEDKARKNKNSYQIKEKINLKIKKYVSVIHSRVMNETN